MNTSLRRILAAWILSIVMPFLTPWAVAQTQPYAWGWNSFGQVGNNSTAQQNQPAPVSASGVLAGKTVVELSAGEDHTLALCSDGSLVSWGWNWYGQLGIGSTAQSLVPVMVDASAFPSPNSVTAIAAGQLHSLALCSNGALFAWGHNVAGVLGNGSLSDSLVPVAVNQSGVLSGKVVKSIAAGYNHCLVLCTDGTLAAWGNNSSGQLGNNSTTPSALPVMVDATGVLSGRTVIAIAAGHGHNLVLCSDGSMVTWGQNSGGQLGNNSFTDSHVPVLVNVNVAPGVFVGRSVVAISAGDYHSLGLCSDGAVIAWGLNSSGQIGENTSNPWRSVPGLVDTTIGVSALAGRTVTAIAAGSGHNLVVCSDGTIAAWGRNSEGQIGDNSTIQHPAPVSVDISALPPGTSFNRVFSGSSAHHSLALPAAPPCPPQILVRGLSVTILNGDTTPTGGDYTAFFDAAVCGNASVTHQFTIFNFGACPLTVTNIVSSNPADFSVAAGTFPIVIPGGGSWADFSVTFNPSAVGNHSATISLINDDPTANPYTFAVNGNGIASQIGVLGGNPSTGIVNGDLTPTLTDDTAFGSLQINSMGTPHIFTLTNSGTATLLLSGAPPVAISGPNAGEFTVNQPTVTSIAPGGTATFSVVFHPSVAGVCTALLSITNSDCTATPYEFAIEGEGIALPPLELACVGNKVVKCDQAWTFDPPTATNACGAAGVTLTVLNTVTNGSCPRTVIRTWLVADACGNTATCSQSVTVVDTMPPTISCPGTITRYTCANAIRVYYAAWAWDACSPTVSLSYSHPSGSFFAAGTITPVTVTATDGCGNTSTCTFQVKVINQNASQILVRGLPDCYNLWLTDPAAVRSACLNSSYSPAFWKSFDNSTINRRVGVSWQGLPASISAAQVTTRMKPRKTLFNTPQNDTIAFGLGTCSPASWLWSQSIGTVLGQPWLFQPNCGVTFAFNLQALPPGGGTTSLLPHLNSPSHRLDMLVQNDTVVDYAWLRIRYCAPIIFNGSLVNLVNAIAVATPSGWLLAQDPEVVGATNASAAFALGDTLHARLSLDLATLTQSPQGRLNVSFSVTDSEEVVEDFGFQLVSTPRADGPGTSWQPFAAAGASNPRVRLMNAGREVGASSGMKPIQVRGEVPAAEIIFDGRTNVIAQFATTVSVGGGAGGPPLLVDAIQFSFDLSAAPDVASTAIVLNLSELPEVGIRGLASGPARGFDAIQGNVLAQSSGDTIVLSPQDEDSNDPFGVSLSVAPAQEFRAVLGASFDVFAPTSPGSSLSLFARGLVAGQDRELPGLRFDYASPGWTLAATRDGMPLPLRRVQVWNRGAIVADLMSPTSVQWASLPQLHWPSLIGTTDDDIVHRFPSSTAVDVVVDGTTYSGTEVRITTGTFGEPVQALTGLRVETVRAELLAMSPLEVGPVSYRLEVPESVDDEVTVRWSGVGGVLESASSLDGAWSPVAGSEGGEVTLPVETAAARFFRVRGQ